MPRAPAFNAAPALSATARGVDAVLRNLPAAVVLVAASALLATTAFNRTADVSDIPRLIPAPSALPAAAPAGDPSVPDASAVFSDRQVDIEEPMSTF